MPNKDANERLLEALQDIPARLKDAEASLADGAIFDPKSEEAQHIMWDAAKNNDLAALEWLKEKNCHLDDGAIWRVAESAAKIGNLSALEWLKENGASINNESIGKAIMIAARHNQPSIIKWLIGNGVNIDLKDHDTGLTAVHVAASNGNLPLLEMLKAHGANIFSRDNDEDTILYYASDYETREWCLKEGVDPHTYTDFGVPGLIAAIEAGEYRDIQLLLKYGVDPTLKDPDGRTAIHAAAQSLWDQKLLAELKARGADIFSRDNGGNTILCYASDNDKLEWCLKEGIDPNVYGDDGLPLLNAVKSGDIETIKLLLKYGANPELSDNNVSAVDYAFNPENIQKNPDLFIEIQKLLSVHLRPLAQFSAPDLSEAITKAQNSRPTGLDIPIVVPTDIPSIAGKKPSGMSCAT